MMKILVLGKNGYVSQTFQKYMESFPECIVDAVSVRNDAWRLYSFSGYDVVFNTAGLAHNDARKGTDEEFLSLNAELPVKLAQKAKDEGVKLFIHMSSMIVYGSLMRVGEFVPITGETVPQPDNIYGRSKLLGEKGVLEVACKEMKTAVIRSPLIYDENAMENFLKLMTYAKKLPLFPKISNCRSMIFADNLCELVRLISITQSDGIFYPQQEKYICTSEIVMDIAKQSNHKIWMTKLFNPILLLIGNRVGIVNKVFGNEAYDMYISDHFNGKYRVVNYQESIRRLCEGK